MVPFFSKHETLECCCWHVKRVLLYMLASSRRSGLYVYDCVGTTLTRTSAYANTKLSANGQEGGGGWNIFDTESNEQHSAV